MPSVFKVRGLGPFALAAFLCTASLYACSSGKSGSPDGGFPCVHDKDCPAGQQCSQNICQSLPCGGCLPDQACSASGACVTAQGSGCADGSNICPADYPCNGQICAKPCLLDHDCDPGTLCNSNVHSCVQCEFNSQCASVVGKSNCDATTGNCVACNVNIDCTKTLGAGHVCEAHKCVEGCLSNNDCNAGNNERCTVQSGTTPGKCIQCASDGECTAPGLHACDPTGHCVQCGGTSQTQANTYCGQGTPECELVTSRCVQCLPANDASGLDCGTKINGVRDSHSAMTCDPHSFACVPGCQGESQCGCPRNSSGEENCLNPDNATGRNPGQEHCDPAATSMVGFTGATEGACVQCRVGTNADCYYLRTGSVIGERCVNDSCTQGCDSTADCTSGYQCHIGNVSNDPNNHKCVQCGCAAGSTLDDGAYCLDSVHCPGDANGLPQVCDAATLLCRKKRTAETCVHSKECGDAFDPALANSGCIPAQFCAYDYHPTTGSDLFCSSPHGVSGKCAPACQGSSTNDCGDGVTHCPNGTLCKQADNETAPSATPHCVANSCTF